MITFRNSFLLLVVLIINADLSLAQWMEQDPGFPEDMRVTSYSAGSFTGHPFRV